jgi:hypothetical protein
VVRADIFHVELLDLEHARRSARFPSKDSQHGPPRLQIADDERGRLGVVVVGIGGLVLPAGCDGLGGLVRLIRFAGVIRLVAVQAQPAGWDH